ncbi:glycoside hydrolase family 97 catalytic domain-containing protein [Pelagicoccus sp. SDUM812005]|uniref:glycoside hydrolase family 97 protein n=1 Tax=Pelagicoccus sp. SDUM812005 TaxID=3041257 RepID=UPI00280DEE0C|nr:glycoside hydrolase family 97 catalytic domain-containing protein [Pelagicoccus sp. SDUM812005]MDQ8183503.1 glycoside hydrolase family 97 catalytic domain-containing protein [Pelagicoccus sp. SDUM812005]
MMKRTLGIVLLGAFAASRLLAASLTVDSPDGALSATFEVEKGALFYSVSKSGTPLVAPSKVEIFSNAEMKLVGHATSESDSTWKPVWGQFSEIRDHHRELTLSLEADGAPVTLLCRAFDSGIGFRFVLGEESKGRKLTFLSEYKPLEGIAHYGGARGWEIDLEDEKVKRGKLPLVTVRADGIHLGLVESDLYSAQGFSLMRVDKVIEDNSLELVSAAESIGEGQLTSWRTIMVGESAGDLAVNTVSLNLAAPSVIEDTSWIKPGKGLWDWRVHGYDNGDFVYGIDTRSYLRYIDFCAEQGLEYFTVDDYWFEEAGDGKMKVSPQVDIEKVMSYAKEKGVMIMLYYDRKKGNFGDETLFEHYADLGAMGMKYGFMGNRADFTRDSMEAAAENRLLINFHDGPVPMSGVERTFPNLITREYCHGQQDSRSAFTPETFIKMALVSSLSGPLDMSNGNFGIGSINRGEREKGPRELNSYISTVVSEVARNLIIYTGLVTLPDAPEEYYKKIDLFEFLKVMPATWDDSLVPYSKIGEYVTVARRSGDTWFVASANDQSERSLDIKLDFLEAGKRYEATIYQDAADSHGVKNPEAYEIKMRRVKRGDVVTAKMAVGGGHAMILRPLN